ncbi:MAG: RNA polymerase sigma factor [Actinomycetota bacterium]|nr:RNA polymerase sigma factor [Actinomycetota bacterium]
MLKPLRTEEDELSRWLSEGYAPAYRTALLLLHNRADAEEAVQDAFLRAWRFRAAVPAGEGLKPWLYRVVVNSCLSRLRADKRRQALSCQQGSPDGDGVNSPEDWVLGDETRRVVLAALAALPEHLRVVVVLRYYAQLNEREIAAVIRRRPGTVKSRLHEARARLGDNPALTGLAAEEGEA